MSKEKSPEQTTALQTIHGKLSGFRRIKEGQPALTGVSAGLARRFKVDPTAVRWMWLLAVAMTGFQPLALIFPLAAYTFLWFLMPLVEENQEDPEAKNSE